MTKVYFEPIHLSQFYQKTFGYRGGELPVTEKVSESVLSLPMYPTLTEGEMDYVAHNIQSFFSNEN